MCILPFLVLPTIMQKTINMPFRYAANIFRPGKQRKTGTGNFPIEEPYYDPEELYGIAPMDFRKPVDSKEIIARMVDGSRFHEFKARYAPTLVTGFAKIHGLSRWHYCQQWCFFSESSLKGLICSSYCAVRGNSYFFLTKYHRFYCWQRIRAWWNCQGWSQICSCCS
jgi:hypothetical protein